MVNKEVNTAKAFWRVFIVFFVVSMIFSLVMAKDAEMTFNKLISLILLVVAWSFIMGTFASLITWISKRKQKLEDKDEINELMRQYLEKKLREDIGKQSIKESSTKERPYMELEREYNRNKPLQKDEHRNYSGTRPHGTVNDMYKNRFNIK